MNAVEDLDKLVAAVNSGRLGVALKIFAGIVRWTWRGCSVVIFLFSVPLLLIGLPYGIKVLLTSPDWSIGDVLMFVFIGLFVGGLALAWRREGLGALLNCIVLGIPTVIGLIQGEHDNELGGYVAWALVLLVLLSWALNTLKDTSARPGLRRIAVMLIPLLVLAIGYCVYFMPQAKFNP